MQFGSHDVLVKQSSGPSQLVFAEIAMPLHKTALAKPSCARQIGPAACSVCMYIFHTGLCQAKWPLETGHSMPKLRPVGLQACHQEAQHHRVRLSCQCFSQATKVSGWLPWSNTADYETLCRTVPVLFLAKA